MIGVSLKIIIFFNILFFVLSQTAKRFLNYLRENSLNNIQKINKIKTLNLAF